MPTKKRKHTALFLLRVWCDEEEADEGSGVRWHGRLQRPTSGEARTFADWAALIAVLEAMLDERAPQVAAGSRRVPIDAQMRVAEKAKERNVMILVRIVFQAKFGKASELVEGLKQALDYMKQGEQRARLLTDLSGPFDTVVLELQHASLAAAEQFRAHLFTTPEFQANQPRSEGLIVSGHQELYTIEAES